mmetsp:Transcript_37327/g.63550  ORF Transcript_37327/g.63550 Transcript_37327/m.63550 type:complete len:312 (+) Transcript_37327:1261-2196(+)
MLLPVIGDGLVEGSVLILSDVIRLAHPDGLHVVEVFPLVAYFLNFLCLLLLLGFLFVIDLFNLWLIIVTLILVVIIIIISDLLLSCLFSVKFDREANELRVLLHKVLNPLLLQVFAHVLLHVKHNASSTAQSRIISLRHGETSASLGRPDVAFVIIILRYNLHLVGNEVRGVESHTELANHGNVSAGSERLHEGLGSGLGNGSEVVDEVGLGHTNSGVLNGERVVGLIRDEFDLELGLAVEHAAVRETLVADLVERIGRVGDELAKKDLLVGVEGVDDQRKELVDVSGEGVAFGIGTHDVDCCCIIFQGIE